MVLADIDWNQQSTAIALVGGAVLLLAWKLFSLGRKVGEVEGRTNAMISFTRQRATIKSRQMVHRTEYSRQVKDLWRIRFAPLMPQLVEWYMNIGRHLNEDDKWVSLQQDPIGQLIFQQVCEPYNVSDGECFDIAILLCRETQLAIPRVSNKEEEGQKP